MRSGLTLHGAEGIVEFRPVEGFTALGRELAYYGTEAFDANAWKAEHV